MVSMRYYGITTDTTVGSITDYTSNWHGTAGIDTTTTTIDPATWFVSPIPYVFPVPYAFPETEEERATRLEAQRVYNLEQERLRREREQAEIKAEALLKEHIGLKAFDKLHQVGYIELDSQKYAGRRYKVPSLHRDYIDVVDEQSKVIDRLCVHPRENYPASDEILARIMMLQFAEDKMLEIANHNPVGV